MEIHGDAATSDNGRRISRSVVTLDRVEQTIREAIDYSENEERAVQRQHRFPVKKLTLFYMPYEIEWFNILCCNGIRSFFDTL